MQTVLLSFRWQNVLAIWVMVAVLFFLAGLGGQIWQGMSGNNSQ